MQIPGGSLAASGQVYSIQLPLESHGGDKRVSHRTCWARFLLGGLSPSDGILQESLALTPGLDVGS